MNPRRAQALVVPAGLSLVVMGCTSEHRTVSFADVPLETFRDVTLEDRPAAMDAPPMADIPVSADVRFVPDEVPAGDEERVIVDLHEFDSDDGIRCTDPRIDDSGVPRCGYCSYPDGAVIGCARCPAGADAGKISLC